MARKKKVNYHRVVFGPYGKHQEDILHLLVASQVALLPDLTVRQIAQQTLDVKEPTKSDMTVTLRNLVKLEDRGLVKRLKAVSLELHRPDYQPSGPNPDRWTITGQGINWLDGVLVGRESDVKDWMKRAGAPPEVMRYFWDYELGGE